ncbi:MAG TPA: phytanoyl-CoA dioxygenase family protein [Polyangiaceae bacterium]|nr:phytanoyl-CoA dioxygenase family protein [Polyangiaceae bacterium]
MFEREGYLILEDALSPAEIERYLGAIERAASADAGYTKGQFYGPENIVERDPVLAELIDHPRHIGFAYDLYGELLKLHLSQIFIRPDGSNYNRWHPDGPRALPYGVFSPKLPLQIKIGYWLTDLPHAGMGNLVLLPRSHQQQYLPEYDTHDSIAGEKILCLKRGTITIQHCGLWHRVETNTSGVERKNIFLAYCPSWIVEADRLSSNPAWLETLTREQRIIMRSYSYGYHRAKPPARDFPLFLDRETGLDSDPGRYPERVELGRRKRLVAHEKAPTR